MKLKITDAQATILWRLLNEEGSEPVALLRQRADISSAEMYALWDVLDDKMKARSIPTVAY